MSTLSVGSTTYNYCDLSEFSELALLPYSQIILLENIARRLTGEQRKTQCEALINVALYGADTHEIEFMPARVLLTDFTGVPCMVDFAAMREAMKELGGDPKQVNPLIPADLVIDHSVIADISGCACAAEQNAAIEFKRNKERYSFLKWAQSSFKNLRIVPPDMGICHQLNLELLSSGVFVNKEEMSVYPDSLMGADSHTTTVNGIGVLAWGVGGIEAEAAMLGQASSILIPKTVGVRLIGSLPEGVGAMDLALYMAHRLRSMGVVGKFVECFGPGLTSLSANDRATVANMSPEYGCTVTLFPCDDETLAYYRRTGRSEEQLRLIETYCKKQKLWHEPETTRVYHELIEIDLSKLEPVFAGPSRPHDMIKRSDMPRRFRELANERGLNLDKSFEVQGHELRHGSLAIAAITSCTTTANPELILAAALLAKKAVELGLKTKPWIKKMWSPGSWASEALIERAGLKPYLEQLGFYTAGFGCMSCIGNSGPLAQEMQEAGREIELAAVLSGNRNFEGRIGPDISQNYLAAPAQVIASALAGTINFDFESQPLGFGPGGTEIYLRDITPSKEELRKLIDKVLSAELFSEAQEGIFEGTSAWQSLSATSSQTFEWDPHSSYVRRPPYFDGLIGSQESLSIGEQSSGFEGATALVYAGDFITTDHISPAGAIALDSPAAHYLQKQGVTPQDFNTYGSRRGNHEVMMRGTFANVKMKNKLAEGKLGGYTKLMLDEDLKPQSLDYAKLASIWSAACSYAQASRPLVVLAGKLYGSGSSRDWAAKGPALIGVKAVLAESFERIHRSNLIGMGIVPLEFVEGQSAESLGLSGAECFSLGAQNWHEGAFPRRVSLDVEHEDGSRSSIECVARVDTPSEGSYLACGGILPFMLYQLLEKSAEA